MANEPIKDTAKWLQLGLRLFSFLEKIFPMFLLAWNERLRNRLAREKQSRENAEYDNKVLTTRIDQKDKYHGKSDRDVIDDFLSDDEIVGD